MADNIASTTPRAAAPPITSGKRIEYLFKMVVVGQIGCGKTSIIRRFCHNLFNDEYRSTIGVDFLLKVMEDTAADGTRRITRVQLWDIAGQERYGNMTRVYYKNAVAAMILVDLSRLKETMKSAKDWKADIDAKLTIDGEPVPVLIVANKVDIIPPERIAELTQEVEAFARECKANGYFIVSAKKNENIESAFKFILGEVFKNKTAVITGIEVDPSAPVNNDIMVKGTTHEQSECIC